MKSIISRSAKAWVIILGIYVILYIPFYSVEQREIMNEINDSFTTYAPLWNDSIFGINDIYRSGTFCTNRYKERHDLTMLKENDTIVISADLFHPEKYSEFIRRNVESCLLDGDEFDLPLIDSLWNRNLQKRRLEVDAAMVLYQKKLSDMFPRRDVYMPNIPAKRIESKAAFSYHKALATDTVEIGICDHGLLVGNVHIPVFFVLKRMDYILWGTLMMFLLIGIVTVYNYRKLVHEAQLAKYRAKPLNKNLVTVGSSILDTLTGQIIFANGNKKLLREQPFCLLKMFLETPGYVLSRKEICAKFWPRRADEDCNSVYSTLISRFRNAIKDDPELEVRSVRSYHVQLVDKLQEMNTPDAVSS